MVINFDKREDYNEVIKYLQFKNLNIENKTIFIQMIQEEDIFKQMNGALTKRKE